MPIFAERQVDSDDEDGDDDDILDDVDPISEGNEEKGDASSGESKDTKREIVGALCVRYCCDPYAPCDFLRPETLTFRIRKVTYTYLNY